VKKSRLLLAPRAEHHWACAKSAMLCYELRVVLDPSQQPGRRQQQNRRSSPWPRSHRWPTSSPSGCTTWLGSGFYQQLGWPIVVDSDDFIVFELRGALLALFPLDQLARDAHTQAAPSSPGIRTSVIISVEQAAHVDQLAAHARAAGATLAKEPTDAEFFQGRDAYFADTEGNYWEIAWSQRSNPVVAAARRAAGQPA